MKKILILSISLLSAVGLALAASTAFGHGAGSLDVSMTSNPRFPIAGQQAQLTFRPVFNDGTPNEGQTPMVMLQWTASGGHTHGPEGEAAPAPQEPAGGSMAGMDMGGGAPTPADGPPAEIMLMPVETSPGVYVDNVTFQQGGRYVAVFSIGDDEADNTLGVRSSPVAWWFIGMLGGLVLALAAVVAVVKTVRRAW